MGVGFWRGLVRGVEGHRTPRTSSRSKGSDELRIILKNIGDTNQDGADELVISGGRPENDGTTFGIAYILDLQSYLP